MSTTTTTAKPKPINLEQLAGVLRRIGPEPIAEWMRSKGFPPETYRLVLPARMAADLLIRPSYVTISSTTEEPMFMLRGVTELVEMDFTDVAAAPAPQKLHTGRGAR